MNNRPYIFTLVALAVAACSGPAGTTVLLDAGSTISPQRGSEVLHEGGAVTITVGKGEEEAGFFIEGQWDLTEYRSVRMKVTNKSADDYLTLHLFLESGEVDGQRRMTEDRWYVAPATTSNVEFDLPCSRPHPEIAKYLTLMRATPYGEFKHHSAEADLSCVRRIHISSSKCYEGSQCTVENVVAIRGDRAPTPDYMELDSAAFFPCFDRYGQFKHKDWPGKTHSDADLQKVRRAEEKDLSSHKGPKGWNKYGGWADGPQYEATGHFRVEKINGKWWMIDPEGCLFWSHGIVRVNPSSAVTPLHGKHLASRNMLFEDLPESGDSLYRFFFTNDELLKPYYERWQEDSTYDFSSANIYRKYGTQYRQIWADLAHRRLRSWGVNTIANSSDIDICRMDRTPFIDRFDIRSKPIEGADGPWFPIMDPFDDSFRQAVTQALLDHKRDIEDPFLLGYFVDNEIKWGDSTHAAKCVANAPESQAAKRAMRTFLKSKYGKPVEPSEARLEDLREFNCAIIEEYYKVIRECFDRYAPGVLYMGCRFSGFIVSNPEVVTIGAKYCDVISHNQYRYTIDTYRLPEGVDKPVMIGEWHMGALDRGMFHPSLIITANQKERAHFYEEYAVSAMKHPNIIGIHWHQFMDQATSGRFDGECFNVGFLDCCDTPYGEMVGAARSVGYDMYETRFNN